MYDNWFFLKIKKDSKIINNTISLEKIGAKYAVKAKTKDVNNQPIAKLYIKLFFIIALPTIERRIIIGGIKIRFM